MSQNKFFPFWTTTILEGISPQAHLLVMSIIMLQGV